MTGEYEVAHPVTGGRKNQKPEQMHHLDAAALLQVATVASVGAGKYSPYNYRKGIQYSSHYDALLRHLFRWWEGEDIDPESGQHHVAHAAWHCLALLSQARLNDTYPQLELDDRPNTVLDDPPPAMLTGSQLRDAPLGFIPPQQHITASPRSKGDQTP